MPKNEKCALVIGLGISGKSATRFLLSHHTRIVAVDKSASQLNDQKEIQEFMHQGMRLQEDTAELDMQDVDFIVLSPGIPSTHPLVQKGIEAQIPVIGEIALGCQMAKNPMMGITGTNGKTTVTLLVTHVLNSYGIQTHALGNVGHPFTQALLTIPSADQLMLELSSYQLETLQEPCLDCGLILNITPDHLDRYASMEEYVAAKGKIAQCLKNTGHVYVEEKTYEKYQAVFPISASYLTYGYHPTSFISTDLDAIYRKGQKVGELPSGLKGKKSHEVENYLAAYALCAEKGIEAKAFLEAWKTFKKPSHRVEFFIEYQGIKFYDDSKGTNVDATIRAVESLGEKIVLIAGGKDKNAPYLPWVEAFKDKVKCICAIGEAATRMKQELGSRLSVLTFGSLNAAVKHAVSIAQKGEAVLLSPGCSSLDMFKDYVHRGQEFQRIVHEWGRAHSKERD